MAFLANDDPVENIVLKITHVMQIRQLESDPNFLTFFFIFT